MMKFISRIAYAPINDDGAGGDSPYDAEAAFMKMLTNTDAETPSEADEEEEEVNEEKATPEDQESDDTDAEELSEEDDEEGDEGDESDEDEPAEKGKKTRVVLEPDADAVVKHKVDGKDVEIPVKDLTRLYGQEAALTRKSQELADARKTVDTSVQKYATGLETLLKRAVQEFEPYSKLNFLALAKDPDITAQDLATLQEQARKAYDNVHFLNSELEGTAKAISEQRQAKLVEEATKGWSTLSDPATGIEGWGEPLYQEVRQFALSAGLDKAVVNELVDPSAIKLIHKAMLYDKGQKAVVKTKKVDKTPKKIIKGATETISNRMRPKGDGNAMAKLKATGSVDDAVDVFLSRMTSKD